MAHIYKLPLAQVARNLGPPKGNKATLVVHSQAWHTFNEPGLCCQPSEGFGRWALLAPFGRALYTQPHPQLNKIVGGNPPRMSTHNGHTLSLLGVRLLQWIWRSGCKSVKPTRPDSASDATASLARQSWQVWPRPAGPIQRTLQDRARPLLVPSRAG